MADLFTANGAVKNPSRFAGVSMGGTQYTGLVTQRSPYSCFTEYLVRKFYGGSRIDAIADGTNREISVALTDRRAPGSAVYNSNAFPPALSMGSWKFNQNGSEVVRVLLDGTDGKVYDATAGQKSTLLTKATGAGAAQVLGVNTELFIGDGVEQKKVLRSAKTWSAATVYNIGDFIIDANGNIQSVQANPASYTRTNYACVLLTIGTASEYYWIVTLNTFAPTMPSNQTCTFVGGHLAGTTLMWKALPPNVIAALALTPAQIAFDQGPGPAAGQTADTGTMIALTATPGTSGATLPTFSSTWGGVTNDGGTNGGVNWTCFGPATQNWMPPAPTLGVANSPFPYKPLPIVAPQYPANNLGGIASWYANQKLATGKVLAIQDGNGNIQVAANNSAGIWVAGTQLPTWAASVGATTQDGSFIWTNYGQVAPWYANTNYGGATSSIGSPCVVVDSNGNLQITDLLMKPQTSGTGTPNWATGYGAFTNPLQVLAAPNAPRLTLVNLIGSLIPYGTTVSVALTALAGTGETTLGAVATITTTAPNQGIVVAAPLGGFGNAATGYNVYTNSPSAPTVYLYYDDYSPAPIPVNGTSLVIYYGGMQPPPVINTTSVNETINWQNVGPGTVLWSGAIQYAISLHCIDGSVTTASPVFTVPNGGLGPSGGFWMEMQALIGPNDLQCDQVWIWRTAQGGSTLILDDVVPNPWLPTQNGTQELQWVDVATDLQLNAFISAPVAESADPPPGGFLPCCYALQRIWGIVGNAVVYSQGPDAVTGNGLTQFAPLNEIPFIGKPWSIFPITVQDGGQVVFTSSGIWIILGSGTSTDPFYARPYFQSVNVSGPNAVTLFNQTFFVIEATNKVSAVAVQFPFQPATGYTEIGLPIGDQFQKVTTGGINAALFNPATAFLSWNSQNTAENALYVADGAGHWFRLSAVSPPESGLMWHPIRTLLCGSSAVQAMETAPGVTQLLIAPASGTGPLLARDATGTVWTDPVAGTPTGYPSWDAKGPNLLCSTGEWADVSHIAAKSRAVGARPVVSVLLNEIAPVSGTGANYTALTQTVQEPARGRKSVSVFSDRYNLLQNGVDTLGDSLLVKFHYGTQAVADELLDWGISASVTADEEEQVNKA